MSLCVTMEPFAEMTEVRKGHLGRPNPTRLVLLRRGSEGTDMYGGTSCEDTGRRRPPCTQQRCGGASPCTLTSGFGLQNSGKWTSALSPGSPSRRYTPYEILLFIHLLSGSQEG